MTYSPGASDLYPDKIPKKLLLYYIILYYIILYYIILLLILLFCQFVYTDKLYCMIAIGAVIIQKQIV